MSADTETIAEDAPDPIAGPVVSGATPTAAVWPQVRAGLEFLQQPFPAATVALAEAHRDEVAPHLVAALEALADDPALADDENYTLHLFAMHLLASWRDRRAFAPLLALGRFHDDRLVDVLFGDLIHVSYGRCLASVSGGDLGPMMALVDDPLASVWIRAAALDALTDCVLEGEADRADVVIRLGAVGEREAAALRAGRVSANGALELLDVVAIGLSDLGAVKWLPAIRQWHADGLIDTSYAPLGTVEKHMAEPADWACERLRSDGRGYVADAATEMSQWAMFDPPRARPAFTDNAAAWPSMPNSCRSVSDDLHGAVCEPVKQVIREHPKVGRNDPCPCGSGSKFKKCHGAT